MDASNNISPSSSKAWRDGSITRGQSSLKYLPGSVLFEEHYRDGSALFPHTAQLPGILKAAEQEFREGLSTRITNTSRQAGGRRKFILYSSADAFCAYFQADREDGLLFFPIIDRDGVTTIGVVQHWTIRELGGTLHRFRFFTGTGFMPELCLSHCPVAFTEHAIQRFTQRVDGASGMDIGRFLRAALTSRMVVMKVNCDGRALVMESKSDGVIALTYKFDGGMCIVTTCLTRKEIVGLEPMTPPRILHFHYRGVCVCPPPGERHTKLASDLINIWRRPPISITTETWPTTWKKIASHVRHDVEARVPGNARFGLLDGVYGPAYECVAPYGP